MVNDTVIVVFSLFLCAIAFAWGYLTGHTVGMIDGRRESEHGKIPCKTDKDREA